MPSQPIAVITGATDGIGAATAKELLGRGWQVHLIGRSPEKGARLLNELRPLHAEFPPVYHTCDLRDMAAIANLAHTLSVQLTRLDLLLLNANAIRQDHGHTTDGFEENLAIGFYGRALLALSLQDLLSNTPNSQILSVVGLNLQPFNIDEPPQRFSSMKALGRWQWAIQVFAREWNVRGKVPWNTWMPGLVKTKILANEPMPARLFVQFLSWFIAIPTERSASELCATIDAQRVHPRRDHYISRTKWENQRPLGEKQGDLGRIWEHAHDALRSWLQPAERHSSTTAKK